MPEESRVLRIGEWRVDPDLDELSREGQTIRLEPRPMRLLLHLAAHAGRVVDVQELLDEVWPNVVVTQGSLYQAVAQLRRILGDDSEHPKYIENLPRRGYRLMAPVVPWDTPCAAATDSTPSAQGVTQTPASSVPAELQFASGGLNRSVSTTADVAGAPPHESTGRAARSAVIGAIVLVGAALLTGVYALWRERSEAGGTSGVESPSQSGLPPNGAPTSDVVFAPPPHSVAVLPFVNLSGDKVQDYFSDGLTEELLNSLSRINELQVAGRTSSFYFKGEHADLTTIAHKLNVAAVLEGSVRRSAHGASERAADQHRDGLSALVRNI
jgi:transcriptional activator of cad operon